MRKPVVIDLFCGLGGWTRGFLAEGWEAIGFDIERHRYPARALEESGPVKTGGNWNPADPNYTPFGFNTENAKRLNSAPLTGEWREYPGHLILADVRSLNGYELRAIGADMIVASPPCQEYSYMAMPWSRAKQIRGGLLGECPFPEGYDGSRTVAELNALFNAALRIAKEAELPIVIENVKGAQPWVGRAKANFGSYYLWGDVARIGNRVVRDTRPVFGMPAVAAAGRRAVKVGDYAMYRDGHAHTPHLTHRAEQDEMRGQKNGGNGSWFGIGSPGQTQTMGNPVNLAAEGTKQRGSGQEWFDNGIASHGSRSNARKAASAMIAEIPFELASHIARVFKP